MIILKRDAIEKFFHNIPIATRDVGVDYFFDIWVGTRFEIKNYSYIRMRENILFDCCLEYNFFPRSSINVFHTMGLSVYQKTLILKYILETYNVDLAGDYVDSFDDEFSKILKEHFVLTHWNLHQFNVDSFIDYDYI